MPANARLLAPAAILFCLSLASCAIDPSLAGDPSPVGRASDPLMMWGLQQELTPSADVAHESFGAAVSVSGDTAVVGTRGGIGPPGLSGTAYVFARSGTAWTQQQELLPSDGSFNTGFGAAVSVSGDTAVVAAPGYDGDFGAVYVFTRSGTTWTQEQQIVQQGPISAPGFGASVAVNGDTLIVGQANDLGGSATVFTRSGTTWGQPQVLVENPPSPFAGGDGFGVAVALDGDTALVGASGNASQGGTVYVFTLSGGAWTEEAALAAADGFPSDMFGGTVALAGDTALVGAPFHEKVGAAYFYARSGGSWVETEVAAPGGTVQFGQSVALCAAVAAIATGTDTAPSGGVILYDPSGLSPPTQMLPTGPTQAMGPSPTLAADGTTIVAGAPGVSNGVGAAFVLVLASADGDACTSADACLSGFCVDGVCCAGASCPAAGPCNAAETCQPGTGMCSVTPIHEGEACDAGACTTSATCHAGVCQGDVQLCAPADACHEFGVCDPSSGACSSPVKSDGQPCPGGTCEGGTCVERASPSTPPGAHGCGCEASGSPPGGAVLAAVGLALLARRRPPRRRSARRRPGRRRARSSWGAMRRVVLTFLVASLGGCDVVPVDIEAYVKKHYPDCKAPVLCGDIAYVDCNAAADGPAYYLRRRTGALISACGGNCMVLMERGGADTEQGKICQTLCPPPEWTCGPR